MEQSNIKKIKCVRVIIKLIAFFLIFSICFKIVHNVTKMKSSYINMKAFFEQEENFDVLFLGSSHMTNSVFPMELWKDYGIISYNLGGSNATIAMLYHNMLLALKETKPKLIVLDLYMVSTNQKVIHKKEQFVHKLIDAYPLSYTKYIAIKDLFGEKNLLNNSFEYLFNFSIYHSRWKELTDIDFKKEKHYWKGAGALIRILAPDKINEFDTIKMGRIESINVQYFKKIIEYCKQNGIEILATYLPFPATNGEIATSKYMQTICDEYNINYINFLGMNTIDYNTDCADGYSHLNSSGARKVTNYIGKYIINNYDIQDQRKNEAYNFWNQDYNEYIDYRISALQKNRNNLNNYLMLLYGEQDIKYEIKISSRKKIEEGSTLYYLLQNINNNYKVDDSVFTKNKNKTIKITTWDNRNGQVLDVVWW